MAILDMCVSPVIFTNYSTLGYPEAQKVHNKLQDYIFYL